MTIVPANELKRVKDDKSLGDKREGVINFVGQTHGIDTFELGKF